VLEIAYELLEAHRDTARLAQPLAADLEWCAHLDYLRALQRVGKAILDGVAIGHAEPVSL
jgi:hypothetical protein